jgi:hypothetical protein
MKRRGKDEENNKFDVNINGIFPMGSGKDDFK